MQKSMQRHNVQHRCASCQLLSGRMLEQPYGYCDVYAQMLQGDDCSYRLELGSPYDACPSGCSGRGRCLMGFCRCSKGYFGADCSRSRVLI